MLFVRFSLSTFILFEHLCYLNDFLNMNNYVIRMVFQKIAFIPIKRFQYEHFLNLNDFSNKNIYLII